MTLVIHRQQFSQMGDVISGQNKNIQFGKFSVRGNRRQTRLKALEASSQTLHSTSFSFSIFSCKSGLHGYKFKEAR